MLSRDSHQQLITTPIGWKDSRREWERSTNSQDTEESGSKKENSPWGEWIIAFKGLVLCIFSNDWIKPSIRCYFSWWTKNSFVLQIQVYNLTTRETSQTEESPINIPALPLAASVSISAQTWQLCSDIFLCIMFVPRASRERKDCIQILRNTVLPVSSIQSLEKISPH